jgi:ketosteroid isomerase-like protein
MMLALLLAAAPAAAPAPVDQIVATERAFAADTAKRGAAYSFRAFVAPVAVGLLPDSKTNVVALIDARQRIESRPLPPQPRNMAIRWWPAFAGASAAGDLGFTTGPVIFPKKDSYGFVFTVWERQPDGGWKFHFDGGPSTDGPSALREQMPVRVVRSVPARGASAARALAEVARIETRLATVKSAAPYAPFLIADSVLMGSGGQPAIGPKAASGEVARRGGSITFSSLGARAARSGDLVFTYGTAVTDGTRPGGYTRLWMRQKKGWRLIVEQVQSAPK